MRYIKKMFLSAMVILTLSSFCSVSVLASETAKTPTSLTQSSIQSRADVIVRKYRINSAGIPQYRRWNETQNRWVDPYWINL